MTKKTKNLSYKGCKNVLNRVAYKLVKQNKKYKHSDSIVINGKKKTAKEIIAQIKKDGTSYGYDEFKSRFMEDVVNKTDKTILPGYVIGASGKTKYNRASYRNIVKVLTEYRKTNGGKNPSKIKVTYEKITPLHDYITEHGCSGMGQCTGYWCGPNSLQQCFYRLTGIHVKESTIAAVAGSTTDGTDHEGLNTVVAWFNKKYNKNIKIVWYNFNDLGKNDNERWSKLSGFIKKGAVFCHLLYRDQWGHYEVPKLVGDNNISILNSLGDSCGSGTYCGYIETRTKATQKRYIGGISQKSIAVLTNG